MTQPREYAPDRLERLCRERSLSLQYLYDGLTLTPQVRAIRVGAATYSGPTWGLAAELALAALESCAAQDPERCSEVTP